MTRWIVFCVVFGVVGSAHGLRGNRPWLRPVLSSGHATGNGTDVTCADSARMDVPTLLSTYIERIEHTTLDTAVSMDDDPLFRPAHFSLLNARRVFDALRPPCVTFVGPAQWRLIGVTGNRSGTRAERFDASGVDVASAQGLPVDPWDTRSECRAYLPHLLLCRAIRPDGEVFLAFAAHGVP